MRLPDFICVGAQKSGTTWLYEQISRHPQVFMPAKELDFFFKPLDLSWYCEQFSATLSTKISGDISPNYAAFLDLACRIHDICPDSLIIHLLRDPVERAFSQWKMARHLGNIAPEISFIDAFRQNLQFMKRRGEYVRILDEYGRFYPLGERSAVFWYDDIAIRPGDMMSRIQAFLGVDSDWQSPALKGVFWPSPQKAIMVPRWTITVSALARSVM
jgi:hypothetical protein